jgi:hypothetical protein
MPPFPFGAVKTSVLDFNKIFPFESIAGREFYLKNLMLLSLNPK